MDPKDPFEGELAVEFRKLAENLKTALSAAWESDERAKLQQEFEQGLSQLGASLKETADEFAKSSTGQRLKSEVEDLHDRVQSGELQDKIRVDLLDALQVLNAELDRIAGQWRTTPPDQDVQNTRSGTPGESHVEEHDA